MLALLMPFLGILGSLLPSVVRIFERKQEIKYELEMAQIQATAAYDVEAIKAASIERQSLYDHDKSLDGGKFINALRASIRPIITYAFFILFVAVKWAAAYVMIQQGDSIPDMLRAVWDADTMALFSIIIAFWFGSRVMEKRDDFNYSPKTKRTTISVTTDMSNNVPSGKKRPAGTGRDK